MVNVYGVYGSGDGAAGAASPATGADIRLPRTEMVLTNVLVLDVSAQEGRSIHHAAQRPEGEKPVGRASAGTPPSHPPALPPHDPHRLPPTTPPPPPQPPPPP